MSNKYFPLLVFPEKRICQPKKGKGRPIGKLNLPTRDAQVFRIGEQVDNLKIDFARYKASLTGSLAGLEPEMALVIEIVGRLEDFRQAVEKVGLEWLGETEIDDLEVADEAFYERGTSGTPDIKPLNGRMYLAMSNMAGMNKILSLWNKWKADEKLPYGEAKWKFVFEQLNVLRRWSVEETLIETGMIKCWRDHFSSLEFSEKVKFQIELFYRKNIDKRKENEYIIAELVNSLGGKLISGFIDIHQIAFHAVKVELPNYAIESLIDQVDKNKGDIDIDLFRFPGVMYFRPTGQSLAVFGDGEGEPSSYPESRSDLHPVAALLDGAPLQFHKALENRLLVDDVFDLESTYQRGDRKHGTAMASLILHGDRSNPGSRPLQHKLYCVPVMQPNHHTQGRDEHMPDEVFFEDRIHIAVRRMFEDSNDAPKQAPTIKVINLSIGDFSREFIHTPSPWARLIDWLSYRYNVLFCVSAGNFCDPIDVGVNHAKFDSLSDEKRIELVVEAIANNLTPRRLLSPAEAINAITVGAAHSDDSGDDYPRISQRVDILPSKVLFSPVSRLGFGFKRSIKPDIFMPGGRQLYRAPVQDMCTLYKIDSSIINPGQKVALDSGQEGDLNKEGFWRGTSNATALATRSAVQLYDMLERLRKDEGDNIPDEFISVLIKALLVHGAKQDDAGKKYIEGVLKDKCTSHQLKQVVTRYLGYGMVDIERVLTCTAQRATVLGYGRIKENEVHEYAFPIPKGLSSRKVWRRLVVTLAWFTPINPGHCNLREAKLVLEPGFGKWKDHILELKRQDGDHRQVTRGTVQHEVFESEKQIRDFEDGETLLIHVVCKRDATARLDEDVPYGLAVTLEAKEDIPIYQDIRTRIKQAVRISAV